MYLALPSCQITSLPADVGAFVFVLEAGGAISRRNGLAVSITVVDQLSSPTIPSAREIVES